MFGICRLIDGSEFDYIEDFDTMEEAEAAARAYNAMPAYWYYDGVLEKKGEWQAYKVRKT